MNKDEVLDLELELSTYCNADCPLCYRNYTTFKEHYPENKFRELSHITAQLDEYPNLKDIRLVGSISEPTLYKNFFELVKYIKDRNVIIEICTNGDTHNPEWWNQLSLLMNKDDKVFFTICGSTQELHNIYRTGTKLTNILENAAAFRKNLDIDYAQCIRFEYNSDNFNSQEFKDFVSVFSNVYMTETFLLKDENNYINRKNLHLLKPNLEKQSKYLSVAKAAELKFSKGLSKEAFCKSYEQKSQQIDINGNVYPCYLFLEASKGSPWDQDYEKILSMQYEVCKFCEKHTMKHCIANGLDYII